MSLRINYLLRIPITTLAHAHDTVYIHNQLSIFAPFFFEVKLIGNYVHIYLFKMQNRKMYMYVELGAKFKINTIKDSVPFFKLLQNHLYCLSRRLKVRILPFSDYLSFNNESLANSSNV